MQRACPPSLHCLQSTLMRAIANGKVDGFPPKEQLRTVYVEHDIDASGELELSWFGVAADAAHGVCGARH